MQTLFIIHSHMRWIVVAMVVITLLVLLVRWMRRTDFSRLDRALLGTAVGLLDLQMLLGIILLFGLDGGFLRYRIEHGVTMMLAIAAAHMTAKWKRTPGPARARNCFLALLVAAILIYVGVMRLPGGWARRPMAIQVVQQADTRVL